MTTYNPNDFLTEVVGTPGNDNTDDTRLLGEDSTINYGLAGNDFLIPLFFTSSILVGGSGEDFYHIENPFLPSYIFSAILENGASNNDVFSMEAFDFDDTQSESFEIDNRHLYLGNTDNLLIFTTRLQGIVLVDWKEPENQIEYFNLSKDGASITLTYDQFKEELFNSDVFQGNLTIEELRETYFPDFDLESVGLSASTLSNDINNAIDIVKTRAIELEGGDIPPSKPIVFIEDAEIIEKDSGNKKAKFTITLDQPSTEKVRVFYSTYDISAEAGEDYQAKEDKKIKFKPGQTEKTIKIQVFGDEEIESDEIFGIRLNSAKKAEIGDNEAIGTIIDNDDLSSFSVLGTSASSFDSDEIMGNLGINNQSEFNVNFGENEIYTIFEPIFDMGNLVI